MNRKKSKAKFFPVCGDDLTVKRIRQVMQQMLYDVDTAPLDEMKFPEPFPVPFHLAVSILGTIKRERDSPHACSADQMQFVNIFFQLHTDSIAKQDPLSIAHTKIILKWKRLKLDKPAFCDGDRFIHLYIGALGHVLMCEEMPDHIIAGVGGSSSSDEQPIPDASESDNSDTPLVYTINPDTLNMGFLKAAAEKIVEEKLMAPVLEVAGDLAEAKDMNTS